MTVSNAEIEDSLAKSLLGLLAAARLCGPELLELISRRMITVGGAGYQEAMGNRITAECFYRLADNFAVEPEEGGKR